MTPKRNHLTAATLVILAAMLAGCESEQEAVPLSLSVPVAVVLFVSLPLLWLGAHLLVRHIGRSLSQSFLAPGEGRSLRWPRVTAALAVAPVAAPVAILWPIACGYVAIAYKDRTYDIFSWDETVTIVAFLGLFATAFGLVSSLVASALMSDRRRGVIAARCVLGLVIAVTISSGVGAVWVPALVLSFFSARPEPGRERSADALEVGGVIQPHESPTTGWAPPGFVGIGAEPFGE